MSVVALAVISMTISFVGCKKETLKYSCDKEINAWAVENENKFHNVTRQQLVALPFDLQLAAFRTLTPEEKSRLWQDKLNTIYDDWDVTTRSIIDKLEQHVAPHLYEKESKADIDTLALEKIKAELLARMDSVDFLINFCILPTEQELDILINSPELADCSWISIPDNINDKAAPGSGLTGLNTCNCNSSLFCTLINQGTCKGGCNLDDQSAGGCGFLGKDICYYRCTGIGTGVVENH